MKASLSVEPDGIRSALLLGGGDSLLPRIVPIMVCFARTTNNAKNNVVLVEIAAAAAAVSTITHPVIKFRNYVEFIH